MPILQTYICDVCGAGTQGSNTGTKHVLSLTSDGADKGVTRILWTCSYACNEALHQWVRSEKPIKPR